MSGKTGRPPAKRKSLRGGLANRFRVPLAILGVAALAALGAALFLARPRAVWVVDRAYRDQWALILDAAEPPRRLRLATAPEEGGRGLPKNWHGFIISDRGPLERAAAREAAAASAPAEETAPAEVSAEDSPLRSLALYPRLAVSREHEGALLLALDPWMMFRDFKDPAVSRERVDSAKGGEGVLVMPGRDLDSRWAWAAQLLQRQSGVFPEDKAAWQAVVDGLFWDSARFQPGAETYGWPDALPLLYRSSPAWLYAPLSRIRRQPPLETGGLEANRYPDAEDWHEFGIQAAMLWAIPFGRDRDLEKLEDIKAWLADPQIHTALANALGWIPAHPAGTPYDARSRSARLAYLSSSFMWTLY
jgi:hypothetical protein